MTIEEYIQAGLGSENLKSNLYGVIQHHGLNGKPKNTTIGGDKVAALWYSLHVYIGQPVKTHTLHNGREIHLSQFVDSVIESYPRV